MVQERRLEERPKLVRTPSRVRMRCFLNSAIMSFVIGDSSEEEAGEGGSPFGMFGYRLSKMVRSGTLAATDAEGGVFSLSVALEARSRSPLRERL